MAIEEVRNIRESIDELATIEDEAILSSLGITISHSESSDSESDTPIDASELPQDFPSRDGDFPSLQCLRTRSL